MQTKGWSLAETATQFVTGIAISLLSYMFLLPLFGFSIPLLLNLKLTAYFAIISIIRSYIVRRAFNAQVRPEMPRVQPRVGSIQSLRRSGIVSEVPYFGDTDTDAKDETQQG